MRYKLALIVFACMFVYAGLAMAFDVGISSQANWWGQAAADREMAELEDAISGVANVENFPADSQDALADWVEANTSDGDIDLLLLCGQIPDTLYEPGNAQADGSLVELFLDNGNAVFNTGDYLMYVVNATGANAEGGIQSLMDIVAFFTQ